MPQVVLLTGADLGDKVFTLSAARRLLGDRVGGVSAASSVCESAAWGFVSDTVFANQVLVCETVLSPLAVLDVVQDIERELGKDSGSATLRGDDGVCVYRSRVIDIDILFYDDLVIESSRLTVPHPLICSREFVLAPLREILGDFFHPVMLKRISEL